MNEKKIRKIIEDLRGVCTGMFVSAVHDMADELEQALQQIKELKRTLAATQNDLQWRDELLRWHRVPWYIKLFTGLWKEPKRLV